MINSPEIARLIKAPSLINSEHIDDLRTLCDKHPFAQLFPILLLKGMANISDTSFDEELQRQSYKIADRVKLYELITHFDSKIEPEIESTSQVVEQPEIEKEERQEEVEAISEALPKSVDVLAETAEIPQEVIEEEASSEQEVGIEPKDVVEESILHHAFAAGYQLEDLTPEEEQALEERESVKEEIIEETEPADPLGNEPAPFTFTGWLHADQNYIPPSDEDKVAIESVVNDFEDFDPLSELTGEIEKPKAEFFSPTKKAKESLKEDDLPVSETLAKIYYLQGNYPKAIEAYEQLSLKFPEKKIFFANQIRDLKKKLNT